MSCQLSVLAHFQDVQCVKRYLFPSITGEVRSEQDDFEGWDDSDWGWKDEDDETSDVNETVKDDKLLSWLQECQVSLSPAADLMAVARDDRLVLLSQKWEPSDAVETKYAVIFESRMHQEEGEKITCVLCLPLASQKRSTQGGPDWTCVILGFTSGYVRIYTETGTLLLSQIFSDEVVQKIRCRTYEPPRHAGDAEKHEELSILYKKSLVTIDGFSIFQSLRACRNQVARAAASGSELMQPPPLAYKKWAFVDQERVIDHTACGLITPNPFDQMQTASMLGGFSATIRTTPPASHLYVSTGHGPYVGFFYAVEGSAQPMLSEVAHAVASKLKSAFMSAASGWLGFSGRGQQDHTKEKKRPKIEPATSLPSRFGLHDKRRLGESVSLSPDSKLAACTDSFGRVLLLETTRGIAVRMWKGYRDAQIGWVEVLEDIHLERGQRPTATPRHSMFLVIYAPKRGILEVWSMQQGPRVAAFNVSKWCRMLCPEHGMMGLNNVTFHNTKVQLHQVYLMDPEGSIKTIDIPFHLALSDKNSKKARDLHLLKTLKISLKDNIGETAALQTEVIDTLSEIRMASVRQQGVERVISTKYLTAPFLLAVLKAVLLQLETQAASQEGKTVTSACGVMGTEDESLDYESKVLSQFSHAQQHLLFTYTTLSALNSNGAVTINEDGTEVALERCLQLSPEELRETAAEIDNYQNALGDKMHVQFEADNDLSVVDFLSCFECRTLRESQVHIQLCAGLSESRMAKLANFLFRSSLERGTTGDYNLALKDSNLPATDLLSLLLHMWLADDQRKLHSAVFLHSLFKSLTCLNDSTDIVVDRSPWWQSVRDRCSNTHHISAALLAAMVGRSVAMEIAKFSMMSSTDSSSTESSRVDMSDWELVTMDKTQWTLLVKQLEDLLALQCLLKMKPPTECLCVVKAAGLVEPVRVSVKKVMDGGRGMLPEFVAKWITGNSIPVSMLCMTQDPSTPQTDKSTEVGEEEDAQDVKKVKCLNPLVAQLEAVQRRLPHSLDSDVLMVNCAWEYMILWNKDPQVTYPLEQALAYLRCIQNAALQHGVAAMLWQMFIVKKVSAASFLMEKVGKTPKERLCQKDIGLGEESLKDFVGLSVELLIIIIQAGEDTQEVPVLNVEDVWQHTQGPTSLVELAMEQKATNVALVEHHYYLCLILHSVLVLCLKSVKPLSLFDSKGKGALFKPLQSSPSLPAKTADDSLIATRKQFLCKVISQAVGRLSETRSSQDSPSKESPSHTSYDSVLVSLHRSSQYSRWPSLALKLADYLSVDIDVLKRHHVCELYSAGCDKLAEEILLTVNEPAHMGSQLLLIAGCRLAYFVYVRDPIHSVDKLSKCPPAVSNWLKTLDVNSLRDTEASLQDTATLIGQVINLLPESLPEYSLAINLVELVNALM
ncbi:Rab3 GTPase-activating protein non-catalytic subunit [Lamellibrachia satsuma]|nr:Rab3 GTPase-activating protein non-catalytic subunit [Lamellibrachia satsuma]